MVRQAQTSNQPMSGITGMSSQKSASDRLKEGDALAKDVFRSLST